MAKKRSDELPQKFTEAERRAYDWLYDCDIRSWVVDMLDKTVATVDENFADLVEFAKSHGFVA